MKNSVYITRLLLVLGLSFTVAIAMAQDTGGQAGDLEDVEIEIVKERQITLPQATRNFEKIPPRPAETAKRVP